LELRPGCDLLQSLEEILNGILGKLRESAGQEAMKALVRHDFIRSTCAFIHFANNYVTVALVEHPAHHGRVWIKG
jgi:hypothetical protein